MNQKSSLREVTQLVSRVLTANTKAKRPGNSRLDLLRLKDRFGTTTPAWQEALLPELDNFVGLQREQVKH